MYLYLFIKVDHKRNIELSPTKLGKRNEGLRPR